MFILFAAISLQTGSGNIYTVRQRYIGNPPHGHSGGSMNLCVCVCVGRVAQAKKVSVISSPLVRYFVPSSLEEFACR